MVFPTSGVLGANIDATSTVSVTCSAATAYTVGLSLGSGTGVTSAAARKMTFAGNTITYGLYRDAARSLPWGSIAAELASGTGTGLVQPLVVYGRVPPQATPVPASYSDTIVVTVTY